MPSYKKRQNSFHKKRTTDQDKIKNFILINTKNGYFTRIDTIAKKFKISTSKTWEIVGELLVDESIESYHDNTGEMKVCGFGQAFKLLNQRKKKETSNFNNRKKPV